GPGTPTLEGRRFRRRADDLAPPCGAPRPDPRAGQARRLAGHDGPARIPPRDQARRQGAAHGRARSVRDARRRHDRPTAARPGTGRLALARIRAAVGPLQDAATAAPLRPRAELRGGRGRTRHADRGHRPDADALPGYAAQEPGSPGALAMTDKTAT